MNNRMDELNSLIDETNNIPDQLGMDNIRKTTKKRAFRHHVLTGVRNTAIALAVLLGSFTLGVNTSPVFANAVKDIPLLKDMASVFYFNEGIETALENQYGSPVKVEAKGEKYNLYVDYVMADDQSIALFFKTDNDGGKTKFQLKVDKCMDKDGHMIETSYTLPRYESDGKYSMLLLEDAAYSETYSFELVASEYSGSSEDPYDTEIGREYYSFSVEVPKKYEPKVYNLNQEVTAGKAKFVIKQIRMYPLSTEIDIENLNTAVTLGWINFALVNEDGSRVEAVKAGTIGRGGEDYEMDTRIIQSGYFKNDGKCRLTIDSVEYLSKAKEIVYFDLDDLTFSDSLGPVEELSKASCNKRFEYYTYSLLKEKNWKYSNMFSGVYDEGHGIHYELGTSEGDNNQYGLFFGDLKETSDLYINDDNQVMLKREFPEAVVNPEFAIELTE